MPPKGQQTVEVTVTQDVSAELSEHVVRTIAEAMTLIKASELPHKITIYPGVYNDCLFLSKNCEIVGVVPEVEGADGVVIETTGQHTVCITGGETKMAHVTLRLVGGGRWSAFHVANGTASLESVTMVSTRGTSASVCGESEVTMTNCHIRDSMISAGLTVFQNAKVTLNACEIYDNAMSGLEVRDSASVTATECKVHRNRQVGVALAASGASTFTECNIHHNWLSGLQILPPGQAVFTKCIVESNSENGVVLMPGCVSEFVECELASNQMHGLQIEGPKAETGLSSLKNCQLSFNAGNGIVTFGDAEITLEQNKFSANLNAPWVSTPRSEERLLPVMDGTANHLLWLDYPDSDDESDS